MNTTTSQTDFSGRLLSRSEIGSFRFTEMGYGAGERLPKHSHEQAYFCLTMKGNYRESAQQANQICSPLTLAFHPAGAEHSVQFGVGGALLFNIEMRPEWIHNFPGSDTALKYSTYHAGGAMSWLAQRLYQEYKAMDALSGLLMEGLLLEIVVHTLRDFSLTTRSRIPDWLIKARKLLHENFSQNLSLQNIARDVDINPVYLATSFRRHFGSTIGEYVRKLRIDFACSQIRTSNRPLTEIAIDAGFCDQSHFSRSFKQLIGVSPSAYRLSFAKAKS